MDSDKQQAAAPDQTAPAQLVSQSTQTTAAPQSQPAKPQLAVPDDVAAALLTVNNLGTAARRSETKLPLKMIFILIGLVILLLLASAATGTLKSKNSLGPTAPDDTSVGPETSNSSPTDDTSNQINQDVKTCSNPLNALASC